MNQCPNIASYIIHQTLILMYYIKTNSLKFIIPYKKSNEF